MTILEMATLLGTQLKLTRGEGCWGAGFSDLVETKDGCILGSLHGLGETAYDAVIDLVGEMQGKTVVIHAMEPNYRRTLTVPKGLSVGELNLK